ncbi:ATP-dependent bile acid permease [Zalerion maritima]|uniref:ATP-dependent bile acid permease n=1 Tax=Zalerion maritima TaxID=339359 RepID=A0AAD5RT11_9PEZI|nr:ATP-dependent bile acid permease [Zalerion maritima]
MPQEIISSGVALGIVALCSISGTCTLIRQLRHREPKSNWYEDADGKSTPEAVASFSSRLPKSQIVLFSVAGCGLSIAESVLGTLRHQSHEIFLSNWLSTAAWCLVVLQSISISASHDSVRSYKLGVFTLFSAFIVAAMRLSQGASLASSLWSSHREFLGLRIAELVVAIFLAFASISLPRRPDVFDEKGRRIDRQYTISAFRRSIFEWPIDLLNIAAMKKDLDLGDMDRPDHYTRADKLSQSFTGKNFKGPLWWSLIVAHKGAFTLQWTLTALTSVLNFTPQWCILNLLRGLEKRAAEGESHIGPDVWIWVVWLGVAIVAQSWMENYLFWLSMGDLCVPVRSQLSTLIFEKSMRRKDVKGVKKQKGDDGAASDDSNDNNDDEDEDEAEAIQKSKQSTINLIGVDAKRASDFACYNNFIPGSFFKLIVSLFFLAHLLGIRALLAGFATIVLLFPVNVYYSKKYSDAQDRLMKARDQKMGVVTEALQGIRQIKFAALEPQWESKINGVREKELKNVWEVFMCDVILIGVWICSPIILAAAALATYAVMEGSLSPSVAFVSLGVFKALEVTLSVVPELMTNFLDAWVSMKRIDKYLQGDEMQKITTEGPEVSFDSATIAWPVDDDTPNEERFILRDLSITFPKGQLSVISGKTGTGKSLLLAAVLGEVDLLSGTISVPCAPALEDRHDDKANASDWIIPGAVAYVAQIPWIENATVRDNIIFGLPFDEARYRATVDACALTKDLKMLSDGEYTEIGANGINLSGGQKWRMTLARAIYSRAGILVMDDIFSAVDAHVGRHIFEKCLCGPLGEGRTRILVTHHVALCSPKTSYLVELGDGRALHSGLLSELRGDGTLERIKSHEQSQQQIQDDERDTTAVNSEGDSESDDLDEQGNGNTLSKATSKTAVPPKIFVEEEARDIGAVKTRVYAAFIRESGGFAFWLPLMGLFLLTEAIFLGRSWWLKIWTGSYNEEQYVNAHGGHGRAYDFSIQHTSPLNTTPQLHADSHGRGLGFYLGIYVALAMAASIVATLRIYVSYFGSIHASQKLFAKANFVVLRAPLRWLDTVPVGRILNRFTADFSTLDSNLMNSLSFGLHDFLQLMGVVVAGILVSPSIILLALVLLAICLYYALRYLEGARPAKRLESTSKSPVFETFGSALTGVTTVRAYDRAPVFVTRMHEKIDDYSTTTWNLWLFNRWMGLRMAFVGSVFAVIVAAIILLTPSMEPSLAGFALAFSLEFSQCVIWTVRHYANIEMNMNAAERIVEYTELPTESLAGTSPPASWPAEGRLDVKDLVVSYADDLPPVLKGLNFEVKKNERVGIIGRTGAGKSSLTLALFRFLEAREGSIVIDGLDVSKVKLHDLRSRLAIIPQDPVLFSGTIRSNLDPFDQQTDDVLIESLRRVHLVPESGAATPVPLPHQQPNLSTLADGPSENQTRSGASTPGNPTLSLSTLVSEGGLNLSQGQRQLLCLARAIVARPKVMVLDEATSAVDMATDALIQSSIRHEFGDSTLLVIAHRLSTIADFDRILVLSDGMVAEYGTPRELWGGEGTETEKWGVFRGMCEESGERYHLRDVVFGKTEAGSSSES